MKLFLTALLFIPFLAFSQGYEIGDKLNVAARSGLNVRNAPGVTGSKVGFLEYGQKVKVISKEFTSVREVYDNLEGGWVEIEKGEVRGYVFDGFLTKLPLAGAKTVLKHDHSGECLFQELEYYASHKFINQGQFQYINGEDGEMSHYMRIHNLGNNHQYIDHSFHEAIKKELQISDIRRSEGIILVKSFFKNCQILTEEVEQKIEKGGVHILYQEDQVWTMELKWMGNRMFFSVMSAL